MGIHLSYGRLGHFFVSLTCVVCRSCKRKSISEKSQGRNSASSLVLHFNIAPLSWRAQFPEYIYATQPLFPGGNLFGVEHPQ